MTLLIHLDGNSLTLEEGNAHTTLGAAISHCDQTDSATKERRHLPGTLHETVRSVQR